MRFPVKCLPNGKITDCSHWPMRFHHQVFPYSQPEREHCFYTPEKKLCPLQIRSSFCSQIAANDANLYHLGGFQMTCCLSLAIRSVWFVSSLLIFAYMKAAVLRSIVLRYVCATAGTRSCLLSVWVLFCFSFFFLSLGLSFFRVFCIIAVSFCMEGTLYVSLPDDVFYLVISGCIIRDKDGKR